MIRILHFCDLKKGVPFSTKQKGKGLDVEAEPPRTKHFLKAVTRETKLQSDKMHLGKKQLNYLICDKRFSQGARKLEILFCPIFQVAEYVVNRKEPFILDKVALFLFFV